MLERMSVPYPIPPVSCIFLLFVHQMHLQIQPRYQTTAIMTSYQYLTWVDLVILWLWIKVKMLTWESIWLTGYPSAITLLISLFALSNEPLLQASRRAWTTSCGITWWNPIVNILRMIRRSCLILLGT